MPLLPGGRARARRLTTALLVGLLALTGFSLAPATTASAALPTLPTVVDGQVESIAVIGDRAFVAGTFSQVRQQNGTTLSQPYLFAYFLSSGLMDTAFRPTIAGGQVLVVQPVAGGAGVYIGGAFSTVNGVTRRRMARIKLDGSLDTVFDAQPNNRVKDIAVVGSRVFIGGSFTSVASVTRRLLAEVNPTTGALVPGFDMPVTGNAANDGTPTVQALRPSPDGTKLAVAHNGTHVHGQARLGVAVINVSATGASLNPWYTNHWRDYIGRVGGVVHVSDVAWGPTSTWFVTTSNGGDRPRTNDTIVRFGLARGVALPATPEWITRQFDSSFAAAVGPDGTVYVGGHFRYTEAPGSAEPWPGDDTVNYGWGPAGGARVLGAQVVGRQELAALDPSTGKARNWHYSADGRFGVTALEVAGDRLLVGHDGQRVGGQNYGRHGAVPLFNAPRNTGGPLSTVTAPIMGQIFTVGAVRIRGTATAPAGVPQVTVEVKRDGEWLQPNGTWGAYYQLPATVTGAGGTSVTWTLDVTLPESDDYLAIPKAQDGAGATESDRITVPFETYDPASAPPTLVVTTPAVDQGNFTSNRITVAGTATDPDGVSAVQLAFFHLGQQGYLQPDGTIAADFESFGANLGTPTGSTTPWSYPVTLPNGSYTLMVTPVDGRGTAPPRAYSIAFTMSVGNPPPAVTITSPLANARIGSTVTISGTATDNIGVQRVQVRLSDLRFGLGAQPNGGPLVSQPQFLEAAVAAPGRTSTAWSFTVTGLPPGSYFATARAVDNVGVTTPTTSWAQNSNLQQRPATTASEPTTTLSPDGATFRASSLAVPLSGTAGYAGGVSATRVAVKDLITGLWLQSDNSFATTIAYRSVVPATVGATSTAWSTTLSLPQASRYQVDAITVGTDGNVDWSSAGGRQTYYVYPGDADPTLEWNSPVNGATVAGQITSIGRAFDDKGVSGVQLLLTNSSTTGLRADGTVGTSPTWIFASVSNPGGLTTNWNYISPILPKGTWTVSVRSVDVVGKTMLTPAVRTVTVR